MPAAAPTLEEHLHALARAKGPGELFTALEAAEAFRPALGGESPGSERWRQYVRPVRSAAIGLARKGRLEIVRKGQVIDPNKPFKGVYKIRLSAENEGGDHENMASEDS